MKLFISFFLLLLCGCYSAGNYPYAEEYLLRSKEKDVIAAIQYFKKANPAYCVPAHAGLRDGRSGDCSVWYRFDFYYPAENKILYTWLRPAGEDRTTFALIAVNDGLTIGKWKDINRDFSSAENEQQKKLFEERILKKINFYLALKKEIASSDSINSISSLYGH